jgi:hypothetical protein
MNIMNRTSVSIRTIHISMLAKVSLVISDTRIQTGRIIEILDNSLRMTKSDGTEIKILYETIKALVLDEEEPVVFESDKGSSIYRVENESVVPINIGSITPTNSPVKSESSGYTGGRDGASLQIILSSPHSISIRSNGEILNWHPTTIVRDGLLLMEEDQRDLLKPGWYGGPIG